MIQGIFMSNSSIVGDRVGDFSSAILQINPTGTALLLALSSGMSRESAADTVFNWFEDAHQAGRTATASGGTTTSVGVADGSMYVPGQVLLVEESGEVLLVTAIVGNTLTVMRGIGGTTVVAIDNTMHVQSIGNAHEEASTKPNPIAQQGTLRLNYVQIFRNSWAVSGTAKAVKFRTGNKVAKNKKDCAMYHAEDMERALIFGVKHVGTLNNQPFRMTDGVLSQLRQYGGIVEVANTGGVAGNYSQRDFGDFIRRVFKHNVKGMPNERIALGGDQVVQVLNDMTMADGNYQITQTESKLGISVWTIVTPFGTLKLMTHPLFNENPTWSKNLMVLHPGAIRKRVLRDTFEENYDTNGNRTNALDADEGVITTELGIEVGAASIMGYLQNVNRAVASDYAA